MKRFRERFRESRYIDENNRKKVGRVKIEINKIERIKNKLILLESLRPLPLVYSRKKFNFGDRFDKFLAYKTQEDLRKITPRVRVRGSNLFPYLAA